MTTSERLPGPREERPPAPPVPRISGDERFVPASHVLVADRQVSHPAFRLWCVLHRLWFLHEPPAMELLQELMGTYVEVKEEHDEPAPKGKRRDRSRIWQPATRRSIERWLCELEAAGWLVWARREEPSRRYHLRTSATSATDTAVLTDLRTLLNSGKATLAEVQALLNLAPPLPADATPESHGSTPGSHQDAKQTSVSAADATPGSHAAGDDATAVSDDATAGSQPLPSWEADATVESHDPILASHDATAESQDTTQGSHGATAESRDAIARSYGEAPQVIRTPHNNSLKHEILQIGDLQTELTPPPPAPGNGDGGGPTATERLLPREGFSAVAAREFRQLDVGAVQAELERRKGLGQRPGAMVVAWRVEPPRPAPAEVAEPAFVTRAARAKAQALAIAPPDASPLDIQYLALDLEDGLEASVALANLSARRARHQEGGVA